MEFIDLKAATRETTGKCPARVLRRDGKIPAVLYGANTEPVKLTVSITDVELAHKTSKTVQVFVSLEIDGDATKRSAMIKELQTNPLTGEFIHADFMEVSMDQKVRVKAPVITTGKCKGVEYGGILQVIRRELEIICRPQDVPEHIAIDVTELEMTDSIHVEDIALEGDMEIPHDVNFTVVTCLVPKGMTLDEDEEGEEGEGEEAAEA